MGPALSTAQADRSWPSRYARFVIRWRVVIVLLSVIVPAVMLAQARGLETDNREDIWFRDGDATLERYYHLQDVFGSDDFVVAAFDVADAFDDATLERVDKMTKRIERLPNVDRVTSLTDLETIRGEADGTVTVSDLIESLPVSEDARARARQQVRSDYLLRRWVVSEDMATAAVITQLAPHLAEAERHEAAKAIEAVVAEETGAEPVMAGRPVTDEAYFRMSNEDWALLLPIMVALVAVLFYWLFRSWAAVVLPLLSVAISLSVAFGAIGLSGTTLNLLSKSLPLILLVLCVASAVHVLFAYQLALRENPDHRQAVHQALVHVTRPCVIANVTTAIGFASFSFAVLPPIQHFGVSAAIGVLTSCVVSLTGLPAALVLLRARGFVRGAGRRRDPVAWRRLSELAIRHPVAVVGVAGVLLVVSLYGLTLLEVGENPLDNFPEQHEVPTSVAFVEDRLFGATSFETTFSGDPDLILGPDFQRRLDAYAQWLRSQPLVERTIGVPDFLKQMNKSFNAGREEAYAVPASGRLIAQYMLLLQGPDAEIERYLSPDGSETRLSARIDLYGAVQPHVVVESALAYVAREFPDFETTVTGGADLTYRMSANILDVQVQSLAVAAPLLVLVLAFLFRSARLLPLIVVANLAPVVFTVGLMGLASFPLNAATVMVACIALGLVVDDTVYLLERMISESSPGRSLEEVIRTSLERIGPALLYSTVIICTGFAVRGLGQFKPGADLGLLTSFGLALAFVCDVTLLPALMRLAPGVLGAHSSDLIAPGRQPRVADAS